MCESLGKGVNSPRVCAQARYPSKRGKPGGDQKGNEKLNIKHWQVKKFMKPSIFNKAGLTEGIRRWEQIHNGLKHPPCCYWILPNTPRQPG